MVSRIRPLHHTSSESSEDESTEKDLGLDDFGGFASAPADSAPAADEDKEEDLGMDDFGESAPADSKRQRRMNKKRKIWGWTILESCLCSSRPKAPAADEDKEEDLGMDDLEVCLCSSRSQSASG